MPSPLHSLLDYKTSMGPLYIIMILSWVYLSAAILLFFAEYSAQMQRKTTQVNW